MKIHHIFRITSDQLYPEINEDGFEKKDWSDFYREMNEAKSHDIPKISGKELILIAYDDADFKDENATRIPGICYIRLVIH